MGNKKVAIIGTGLAGLACGTKLAESNSVDITFFEKGTSVGGRVATSLHSGFVLDKGFQVILSAYPHFKEFIKPIETRSLARGATFIIDGQKIEVELSSSGIISFFTNWKKIGEPADFIKLLKAIMIRNPKIKTNNDLFDYINFSDKFKTNFLLPFFRGVLNSKSIETDVSYFKFLLKMFAMGPVVVPKNGMNQMPRLMFEKLQLDERLKFNFGASVSSVTNTTVELTSGEQEQFDCIVCACDPWALSEIEGVRSSGEKPENNSPLTTFYVKTKSIEYNQRSLVLPVGNYKINHIAPMGHVYASSRPYISVNVLDTETDYDTVLRELCSIYSTEKSSFELIDIQKVYHVLPKVFHQGALPYFENGIFYCGDYMETPSIDGALLSGKKVASHVLSKL